MAPGAVAQERREGEAGEGGGSEGETPGAGDAVGREGEGDPRRRFVGVVSKGVAADARDAGVAAAVQEQPGAALFQGGACSEGGAPCFADGGGAEHGAERQLGQDQRRQVPPETIPPRVRICIPIPVLPPLPRPVAHASKCLW